MEKKLLIGMSNDPIGQSIAAKSRVSDKRFIFYTLKENERRHVTWQTGAIPSLLIRFRVTES